MSTNVYGPQEGPAPDFLRNTYDKQFQNLITTNFGDLRVCFCKEVLPGDSVNIDPVVAIRSQPIVFPIQTRMKFYCHFFYGRNRILMKNWEDFIFKTKDGILPPLLKLNSSRAKKMISTGSLGDNLGVPSTFGTDSGVVKGFSVTNFPLGLYKNSAGVPSDLSIEYINTIIHESFVGSSVLGFHDLPHNTSLTNGYFVGSFFRRDLVNDFVSNSILVSSELSPTFRIPDVYVLMKDASSLKLFSYAYKVDLSYERVSSFSYRIKYHISDHVLDILRSSVDDDHEFVLYFFILNSASSYPFFVYPMTSDSLVPSSFNLSYSDTGIVDSTDDFIIDRNPFIGDTPSIPLSALPFRLYEFICNYYYRNDTNNPYVLDGEPQYNRFIPTTDDGWDDNEYLIHKRNWESDMFTTCVPSPQFGTAPLVGLTYNGGLTATVSTNVTDSDGQTKELDIQVGLDDEGYINSIINADTGVPSGSLKQLMDAMSTTGISINTLRNVNSFQRFLENVIRRGLRYRNQLLSHFGVSVDYPDIDIPQFIGGFSGDLVVREVTNMAESADVSLGDVAGKIDAVIQSNHSINCYCAEHGFIMGIFSIVPVPTYSQVLPHMFTRYDAFDYFQKEFDKIGYVPVTYRNFLPLQADNPDEVFGYQRAWYEYMSSLDEVHGDFRLSLDDFVLYRIFKDKPTLNETFLKVDSESLNNIFAVDKVEEKYKNSDKFLCQFYFQYSQKTMIPKHGVASLE